ncbi:MULTISPECIES: cupin domain-containing protein [unclassified Variovorax]|jgi:mannose-6-phosphate isomerase-like protein (cupin superfamily)|uniref:cupin domain-containing protein n=1 Tax=unclassified Variovorax TaxID=663243 RepID=UPI0011FE844D|nr:cupin domain-containing protein [Variovorax sp.]TAJ59133.1 MAG: cupin domain-containing protein [Variovorax sp.]
MAIPQIRVTREEMRQRVAYFKDLKGFDGGLPDSRHPSAERKLYNAVGFQPPRGKGGDEVVSPVGAQAAENAAIRISEGFNLGFCEAKPGKGPMMHNHDTNETFMPLTGRWRCSWELDGREEYFDVGPWDIFSFPAGVNRRFENITHEEPGKTHFLMFVIGGNAPEADFTEEAKKTLREEGLLA